MQQQDSRTTWPAFMAVAVKRAVLPALVEAMPALELSMRTRQASADSSIALFLALSWSMLLDERRHALSVQIFVALKALLTARFCRPCAFAA